MDLKKILIFAGIGLVIVVVIGVVLFMFVFNKGGEPKEEPVVYFEFPLGEMYSNINDEKKILKSNIIIQYTDETLGEAIPEYVTRIKNDIFQLYRTRTYEQLTAPNGQQRLREDIKELVTEVIGAEPDVISDILFSEFILQ